jgi:hypothetical protein
MNADGKQNQAAQHVCQRRNDAEDEKLSQTCIHSKSFKNRNINCIANLSELKTKRAEIKTKKTPEN